MLYLSMHNSIKAQGAARNLAVPLGAVTTQCCLSKTIRALVGVQHWATSPGDFSSGTEMSTLGPTFSLPALTWRGVLEPSEMYIWNKQKRKPASFSIPFQPYAHPAKAFLLFTSRVQTAWRSVTFPSSFRNPQEADSLTLKLSEPWQPQ